MGKPNLLKTNNEKASSIQDFEKDTKIGTRTSGGVGSLGDLFSVEGFELEEERSSESRDCCVGEGGLDSDLVTNRVSLATLRDAGDDFPKGVSDKPVLLQKCNKVSSSKQKETREKLIT